MLMGDPDKGIIAIVAMPIGGDLCLLGTDPARPPDVPGIRIRYDPSDLSSSLVLQLTKGMRDGGILPRMHAWEENGRGEMAVLFDYRNPPEALWRKIAGVQGLAWRRCVKIFTTCEPDYPLDIWWNCLKSFREKNLFIVQILSGDRPWVQFSLSAVQMSKPIAPA